MRLTMVARAAGLIALAIVAGPTNAQDHLRPSPWVTQSKVIVDYGEEPTDPQFRAIYESMTQRKVLERLQRFLTPLRFTRTLTVRMAQCGPNVLYRPYRPGGDVTICYEFVKRVEDLAPPARKGSLGLVGVVAVTRESTVIGPILEEVLHDVALAVFDNLEVPVWGRLEDAADNVAALIMLQFGTDVAQTTILGTAYFLYVAGNNAEYTLDYVADIRPPVRQRYYNILCVAYGADPVKFSMLRAYNRDELKMDLPKDRADECAYRYQELAAAFKTLILDPYVDPDLLKQVLAIDWLKDP